MNSSTGELSSDQLDREAVSKYVLTISAKDNGRPSLEVRCNLTIIVLDDNDNSPTFLPNQYSDLKLLNTATDNFGGNSLIPFSKGTFSTTISEDTPPDTSIMQVKATDPDQGINGKIIYSLAEETTWLFRVDNLTGVITTAGLVVTFFVISYYLRIVSETQCKNLQLFNIFKV